MDTNETLEWAATEEEIFEYTKKALTIAETLPIPGCQEILGPLNAILGMIETEPDPIEEVLEKVEEVSNKLDNMFNVIKTALDLNDVETNFHNVENAARRIGLLIKDGNKDAAKYQEHVEKVGDNCFNVANNAKSYLSTFGETADSQVNTLTWLIGKFFIAVERFYAAYVVQLDCYRDLQVYHDTNKKLKGNWDFVLDTISADLKKMGADYENFMNHLDEYYPDFIKPVMAGDHFCMRSSKKSDLYLSSDHVLKETNSLVAKKIRAKALFRFINISSPEDAEEGLWKIACSPVSSPATEIDLYTAHIRPFWDASYQRTYVFAGMASDELRDKNNDTMTHLWKIGVDMGRIVMIRHGDTKYDKDCEIRLEKFGSTEEAVVRKKDNYLWEIVPK